MKAGFLHILQLSITYISEEDTMGTTACVENCVTQFITTGGARYVIQASTDPLNNMACTIHIEPISDMCETTPVPPVENLSNNTFAALTPREGEVAKLIVGGYTNQEIAADLCISVSTVKCHIQNIFEKLKVSNRSMLVSRYFGAAA